MREPRADDPAVLGNVERGDPGHRFLLQFLARLVLCASRGLLLGGGCPGNRRGTERLIGVHEATVGAPWLAPASDSFSGAPAQTPSTCADSPHVYGQGAHIPTGKAPGSTQLKEPGTHRFSHRQA